MSRISPELLQLDRYPFRHVTTTRFADMDRNQHINNVAMSAALEDARFRFDVAAGVPELTRGLRVMVAATYIDYLAEARYPDPLEIHVGILAIGRSSWTLGSVLAQDERACAFAKAVNVCADENGPVPMVETLREAFAHRRIRLDTDALKQA